MLQILLFLTAQLFALSLSSTLSPMAPATELTRTTPTTPEPITTTSVTSTTTTQTTASPAEIQVATQTSTPTAVTPTATEPSTQQAESLHNNVFVFLNERIDDPDDMILRDYIIAAVIPREAEKEHILAPIQAVKKLCLFFKENLNALINAEKNDSTGMYAIKNYFKLHSFYLINNSRYCLILPREFRNREAYEQCNLLDISACTPLCREELLSENDTEKFIKKLLIHIKNIEQQLSAQKKDRLKKESAVFQQLFTKQVKAHHLFASEHLVDERSYTKELYKLATRPWLFYLYGHGSSEHSIAGFNFETGEIWKILKILNHLSTSYLIIFSCHAGGVNREILTGRYPLSTENFSAYKKLEALINSLTCSYKIVLCSPTDAISTSSPGLVVSTVQKLIKKSFSVDELEEKKLLEILGESSLLLGKNLQINQLPLINRPYQSTFKPFLPPSTKEPSLAVIENAYTITSTTQHKRQAETTAFSLKEKAVIETDQSIISRELKIKPQISSLAIREQIKSFFKNGDTFCLEKKLPHLFPVVSDQKRRKSTSKNGKVYKWYPQYPFFLSLQTEDAYHYLHTITTRERTSHLPGEQGVFLCLRDLFFNANTCASKHSYFIKNIIGINDIPQTIINKKSFGENFPQEGAPLTLSNVAIANYYNIENKVHYLLCAFSHQESYYFFALGIENENNSQDWGFIQKFSQEQFEQKICLMEDLACSKIYDRLKNYPESHPQNELIKQYLDGKKSIFLDFENSYPLFKDDHLPEDDRAWEQLPELLKKHGEKQKGIGSIAEHQLKNQETFAPVLKKIEEYQKRPILEKAILEDHENGHPEDSQI